MLLNFSSVLDRELLTAETFFSKCTMSTTMAQMESSAMQMVVSLAGFGPHTDWREDCCLLGMVTAQTLSLVLSGSVLASWMSGSVHGEGKGGAMWSLWPGLGMIRAGPGRNKIIYDCIKQKIK